MADSLKERITKAFEYAQSKDPKKTKTGLAEHCKTAKSSVSSWFSGKAQTITAGYSVLAAEYLGVSSRWLATGEGEMLESIPAWSQEAEQYYIPIPEYRITFAGGDGVDGGCIGYEELNESTVAYYPPDFFYSLMVKPKYCKRFRVKGDSMEPVICDGDTILVDCSPQEVIDGRVYAFVIRGQLKVKQLYSLIGGGYLIHSFNPTFPDEELKDDDLDTFHLVGRVRERQGRSSL